MRENGHPSAHFLVCLASPEDLVSIAVQDRPGWDTQDFQMVSTSVREDPYQLLSPTFGHRPFGGVVGGVRIVWGTYLEKNCPSSNRNFLVFWGVLTLARMVWGTYLSPQR